MQSARTFGAGLVALVGALAALAPLGCNGEIRPASGQLMIAVSSDMLPGRDFDDVRVVVNDPRVSGEIVRGWRWGEDGSGARLPGTVAVVGIPDGSGTPTSVRVEGWQRGVLRVVREARVVLPKTGNVLLRTPVEWSCLDILPRRLAPGDALVTCDDGQTCVGGRCVPIDTTDAESLPTYSSAIVFGGGEADGGGGTCVDVFATFANGRAYTPESFSGPCGITRPGDVSQLNVGVLLAPGSAGYCAPDACIVPLDFGSATGWRQEGARIVVPSVVCDRGARLALATGAPAKTESVPPCNEWSSVGQGTGASPDPIVLVPAGADAGLDASVDASVQDASGVDAATGDAASGDAGFPDAGIVDAGCVNESDSLFCQRQGAVCGSLSGVDNCGRPRTVTSCGTCAGLGYACGVGAPPNRCGCIAEGDPTFCARKQKNCGPVTDVDNCANPRTVASCGTCSGNDTCGALAPGQCGCAPESDASFCSPFGRCTTVSGTDKCGTARTNVSCTCAATETCNASLYCDATAPTIRQFGTTGVASGDGISNCGLSSNQHCASSTALAAGSYVFGTMSTVQNASISQVLLDRFEVTVGRFRTFVTAWNSGWRPTAGKGRHEHVGGGLGVAGSGGSRETGWDPAWNAYVGAPGEYANEPTGAGATDVPSWTSALTCNPLASTWSATPGSLERAPQNCLSWYDLYAFCVWDGGFLPTETEWEYAAAGGSQERTYPWGSTAPGADVTLANYNCGILGSGPGIACTSTASIAAVGSSPAGAARWGHFDVAGNLFEWNLDFEGNPPSPCADCANLTFSSSGRILRGGAFGSSAQSLSASMRGAGLRAGYRGPDIGGRCARSL
jgi:formylglycine-generating enzyme